MQFLSSFRARCSLVEIEIHHECCVKDKTSNEPLLSLSSFIFRSGTLLKLELPLSLWSLGLPLPYPQGYLHQPPLFQKINFLGGGGSVNNVLVLVDELNSESRDLESRCPLCGTVLIWIFIFISQKRFDLCPIYLQQKAQKYHVDLEKTYM